MFKKIFAFIFLTALLIMAVINFNVEHNKYSNKEKIIAEIYSIDKQSYEYEYADSDYPGKRRTRTGYKYIIYYSFYYNGEEKTGYFEGNNILYKEGHNLVVYYDKLEDISIVYVLPLILIYIVITFVIYLACYILCYKNKINLNILYEHPNPPLFIQLIIIGMSYLSYRVDNTGGYLLSFFFMITSIGIAIQTLITIIKHKNINKC